MYHMYYNDGIFWWLMPIMHFAFPIIFILIIFKLFSSKNESCNHFSGSRDHKTPLSILKERYTKGEISKEEFKTMKDEIKNS